MPTYAYRCRSCSDTFELRRSMTDAREPAVCPQGHDDTVKLLTTVALTGSSGAGVAAAGATAAEASAGGGCCGGGCCG
ncbi:MAG: zinc ribbon domain-containing protein [Micromonosporaceae bacterium]|nr:zinc ribbon domain-containing protein [Micromonosporaceae bacterium]